MAMLIQPLAGVSKRTQRARRIYQVLSLTFRCFYWRLWCTYSTI